MRFDASGVEGISSALPLSAFLQGGAICVVRRQIRGQDLPPKGNRKHPCCPSPTELEGLANIRMSYERLVAKRQFSAVAQMVVFGLRRPKIPYLSRVID
jgi:hypothetical protein